MVAFVYGYFSVTWKNVRGCDYLFLTAFLEARVLSFTKTTQMKKKIQKTTVLFWVFAVSCFLFSLPANAVHPVNNAPENITIDLANSTVPEIEEKLGRDLNWREKIGLRILKKRLKKAMKRNAKTTPFPSNDHLNQNECYTIILKSGDRMRVTIQRKTEEEVFYKPCGQPDATEEEIQMDKIGRIYASGGKIVYNSPGFRDTGKRNYSKSNKSSSQKQLESVGVASFSLQVLSFIFILGFENNIGFAFGAIGLVLGIISIVKFGLNRGKFKGLIFGILATLAGLLLLAVYILFEVI